MSRKPVEPQEPIVFAKCEECGYEQADMGRNVQCEECGHGPMPSVAYRRSNPIKGGPSCKCGRDHPAEMSCGEASDIGMPHQ